MSKKAWYVALGVLAVGFSALLYYFHYLIFRDPHHIFIYMVGDLAFVGLEVLMVSVIVDQVIRLLENPMLLEHESFTDQLWAVFHLTDELAHRPGFDTLPKSDLDHLSGDMERIYGRLTREWVCYMRHLKDRYPYLFSLAVRLNPFQPEVTPVVTGG